MANFPLASKQDASKFGFEQEDVGIRSEMEGGYVLTRPRHTRKPRRTWKTGFSGLSDADKIVFEEFINDHGTYLAFSYTVPISSELVNCRFKSIPRYKYLGWGYNSYWDIDDIVIEEV